MCISKNIIDIRTRRGLTQKQMARMLDINISTYAHYEQCVVQPSQQTIEEIAAILNVHMSELYEEDYF